MKILKTFEEYSFNGKNVEVKSINCFGEQTRVEYKEDNQTKAIILDKDDDFDDYFKKTKTKEKTGYDVIAVYSNRKEVLEYNIADKKRAFIIRNWYKKQPQFSKVKIIVR